MEPTIRYAIRTITGVLFFICWPEGGLNHRDEVWRTSSNMQRYSWMRKKKTAAGCATSQVTNRESVSMVDLHRESFAPPRSGPIAIPGAGDTEGSRSRKSPEEREKKNLLNSYHYSDEQEQTQVYLAHWRSSLAAEPLMYRYEACHVRIQELTRSLKEYFDSKHKTLQ